MLGVMEGVMTAMQAGLDGIVVAETELSDVDGERGELIVRGYTIEDLVGHVTFEDACVLLWSGRLPEASEREQWRARLAMARRDAFARLAFVGDALELPDGMDAVRAALAHLSPSGDWLTDTVAVTAATGVFAAAWARRQRNERPVDPDVSLSHAADYLRMVTGQRPSSSGVEGVDAYLCCVIDHGLNASTLAARVVASTGSDLVSAVVAGVGALKGPLHGGAPGPVLDMLDAIGAPEHTRAWLRDRVAAGERIMGMGHRVYRVRDPRAAALERVAGATRSIRNRRRETDAGEIRGTRGGGAARRALSTSTPPGERGVLHRGPARSGRHPEIAVLSDVRGLTRGGLVCTLRRAAQARPLDAAALEVCRDQDSGVRNQCWARNQVILL
jgi:citrate synthase